MAGFITASRNSPQETTGNVFLRCYGPGFCPTERVKWTRITKDEGAEQFLKHSFIDPESARPWLAQRMALRIPYSA
ncbi:Pectinesterase 31 [Spatholobus suberectus]|nr:Pectinesterase 31 [Spatholobus suberectus]